MTDQPDLAQSQEPEPKPGADGALAILLVVAFVLFALAAGWLAQGLTGPS